MLEIPSPASPSPGDSAFELSQVVLSRPGPPAALRRPSAAELSRRGALIKRSKSWTSPVPAQRLQLGEPPGSVPLPKHSGQLTMIFRIVILKAIGFITREPTARPVRASCSNEFVHTKRGTCVISCSMSHRR
jgi:hypothetical protein